MLIWRSLCLIYFCPTYWLEPRKQESCCKWLLSPPISLWSYLSELPEVPKIKYRSSVCGLRGSKDETEGRSESFQKSSQKFLVKDGQTSLSLFLVLVISDLYSVMQVFIYSFSMFLHQLDTCSDFWSTAKITCWGELKQTALWSCLRLRYKRVKEGGRFN